MASEAKRNKIHGGEFRCGEVEAGAYVEAMVQGSLIGYERS